MNQIAKTLSGLPQSFIDIAVLLTAGLLVHLSHKDGAVFTVRVTLGESSYAADVPDSVTFMALGLVLFALSKYVLWLVFDVRAWWRR